MITCFHMNTDTTEKGWKDWSLRAIALIGLVAILVLGAWGIIQLAFDLSGVLDGIGGGVSSFFEGSSTTPPTQIATSTSPAETINVTNPSLVNSGQPFTLSWTHTGGSGNYAYQISYACTTGLSLKAPLPTGGTQVVPCNTPFNYTNATGDVALTPTLTGTKQVSVAFTVAAQQLSSNTVTVSGSSMITVLPLASVTGTYSNSGSSTKAPATTYVAPKKVVAALYGLPNFVATIVAATPTATGYSVQFLIRNAGTNTTPSGWTFAASVPSNALSGSGYNYQSQPQRALSPGASILYTMNFSTLSSYSGYTSSSSAYYPTCGYKQDYTYNGYANYPDGSSYNCSSYSNPTYSYPTNSYGDSTFSVTVDPSGYVAETSKADNTASVTVSY
jgi:hypothetical protein